MTSVKQFKQGEEIVIAGQCVNETLGATYLVTKYSLDKKITNGFNQSDLDLVVIPPAPTKPVEPPKEEPKQPEKPVTPEVPKDDSENSGEGTRQNSTVTSGEGTLLLVKDLRPELMTADVTYRDWETDRKSTRLNSSHSAKSRMPSSA